MIPTTKIDVAKMSCKIEPDVEEAWLRASPLFLLAGEIEAYKQFRIECASQFSEGVGTYQQDRFIKACMLYPFASKLPEFPIDEFRSGIKSVPTIHMRTFMHGGSALVSYRQGDFEGARSWVSRAPRSVAPANALVDLVSAMTEFRLGEEKQARDLLEQVSATIPSELRTLGRDQYDGPLPVDGDTVKLNWLIAEVLRREAAALILGTEQ